VEKKKLVYFLIKPFFLFEGILSVFKDTDPKHKRAKSAVTDFIQTMTLNP
jgi:hypothetical protein